MTAEQSIAPTIQELVSSDGTHFTVYAARALTLSGAGLVLLPGGRGLLPVYQSLLTRFAKAGVDVVAIDHFGRTAGVGLRYDTFPYQRDLAQTTPQTSAQDVAAVLDYLRSGQGGGVRAAFTVGFSFGGAVLFLQSTEPHGLAGAIGFYGWPLGSQEFAQWPRPIDRIRDFRCPVLAFFGGEDKGISSEAIDQFEIALRQAPAGSYVFRVPGAPHGFFDRRSDVLPEACTLAWLQVLAFIYARTPVPDAIKPERAGADRAFGAVHIARVHNGPAPDGFEVLRVSFEKGAATRWHCHPRGQMLYGVSGRGQVVTRMGNQEIEQTLVPGDFLYAPPYVWHWHGAMQHDPLVHIAIQPVLTGDEYDKAVWV